MVMVRAHTLDFVPLAGIAGWSVSAEKGGGHVWWRARLDERGTPYIIGRRRLVR